MKQSEAGGHLIVAVAWLIIIAVFDLVVITIDTFTAAVVTNIVKSAVVEATLGSWWWSADVVEPARLASGAVAVLELAAILTHDAQATRRREPTAHGESPISYQHKPAARSRTQTQPKESTAASMPVAPPGVPSPSPRPCMRPRSMARACARVR